MKLDFKKDAFRELRDWVVIDRKKAKKILDLIDDIQKHPFEGIGKPEPLKHDLSGCWSRRIDLEHRLVYRLEKDTLEIISCKYHY